MMEKQRVDKKLEGLKELIDTLKTAGYEVVYERGDYCKFDYEG